ncbi:MAG TPA: TonB-dependent receptor [Sphingomonas sp.]|jgi:iron complex outermembrane receptor protein|uniref:TonB-dependent receptor family protein n=1 Tax=Sphingomonas sp. TaxID=28214 RepID=UPI002EDAAEBD
MSKRHILAAIGSIACAAASADAQTATKAQTTTEARRADLLRQRDAIDAALRALDQDTPPRPIARPIEGEIVVTGSALPLTTQVRGQTVTTIDDRMFRNTPATTIADIVKLSPGVAVIQGNGPRDVGVSIRGSNARNSFGARNIVVFEDDFPVTQPDGLARFDLTDPHAYGAVDVVRGQSSARYGNYATGGAVNFRTRRGRDIDGLNIGLDGGSDRYANLYATIGHAGADYDYALFGSVVRATGATGHNRYETGTLNGLVTYQLSDRDRLTGKLIYNEGEFQLSTRLSLNDYRINPYQRGCETIAAAAPGCGRIAVLVNGVNGARIPQTAAEADLARNDRRTIAGTRYEHDFAANTTWRTQATFDSRVVNQPTSATPFKGTLNSYNLSSDVTHHATILGRDATGFAGIFYNYLDNQSYSFNKTPAGRNGIGAPTQTVFGDVRNLGARARTELALTGALQLIAGVGAERSIIDVRQTGYAYPVGRDPVLTVIPAARRFWNVAPEAALLWRASEAIRLHARFGTGYGIPQSGALFVTAAGVPGNNVSLKTQRNRGIDVGVQWDLGDRLHIELTGYQEWFRNEQVSQSAGADLLAYTANAPRSVHRGVEFGVNWMPAPGLQIDASYSHNDQRYTEFVERLSAGGASATFDRDGNRIPGVIPTFVNARVGYDQRRGRLRGMGGFVELGYRARYWIDNANLLAVPGYTLVNLNLHYDPPKETDGWSRLGFFASVQNLFDRTYVGSAAILADSLNPATGQQNPAAVLIGTGGSIYAGAPRTVYAGVRGRF